MAGAGRGTAIFQPVFFEQIVSMIDILQSSQSLFLQPSRKFIRMIGGRQQFPFLLDLSKWGTRLEPEHPVTFIVL